MAHKITKTFCTIDWGSVELNNIVLKNYKRLDQRLRNLTEKSKLKKITYNKEYYEKYKDEPTHREKRIKSINQFNKVNLEKITDSYVKKVIKRNLFYKGIVVKAKDISKEQVELGRKSIILWRKKENLKTSLVNPIV